DHEVAAVRAESEPGGLTRFLAQHTGPVGHTPHFQRVTVLEVGQVAAIEAENENTPLGWSGDDVLNLPLVRKTSDTDRSLVVGPGKEPAPTIHGQHLATWRQSMPGRTEADVREGHRGDGFVAQPVVGVDGSGLGESV